MAVALVGCTPRTKALSLPMEMPETFSESGVEAVPDRWWTTFDDAELNEYVNSALRQNFNLNTAWYRLREARAVVVREAAFLYPDIEAFSEGEIGRSEFDDDEGLQLGLASSYEVDLWGRIDSLVEAEKYQARAVFADYQTAALSLSAEVVRTWYQIAEARSQSALLEDQIGINEKVLDLLKVRFGSGQVRSADILRQEQLLEATRQQKYAVTSEIQVLEHQLAVLLGRAPVDGLTFLPERLPDLKPLPETGLPAELVRRRPDVQSAYNLLKAADRRLAAAISDRFPRLTLTGSVSTDSQGSDRLFEDWALTLAGSLVAPLFDAGQRAAEVDRTEAQKRQQLYQYGQAVIVAFQEVENALIREKKQRDQIRSLQAQVRLAKRTAERLRIEYLNGIGNFIDVLIALREEQRLQRDFLSARLLLLEYRIALYRALAGGFETDMTTEHF